MIGYVAPPHHAERRGAATEPYTRGPMTDAEDTNEPGSAVGLRPGNPDGKGVSGVMVDVYANTPRGLVAKPRKQVLAEYFTSLLVLSAHFKYKPSVGVDNYLYFVDGRWTLSLIAPDEWSHKHRAGFAGTCALQPDMTWTIEPSANIAERKDVIAAILRFYEAFEHNLASDLPLEEILPFCVWEMPYYQRIGANALSRSIRDTVALGGQQSMSARDWLERLPGVDRVLLGGPR